MFEHTYFFYIFLKYIFAISVLVKRVSKLHTEKVQEKGSVKNPQYEFLTCIKR